MTTRPSASSSDSLLSTQYHLPIPYLPTQLSILSKKTDDKAQKTLRTALFQTSPIKRSRAEFDADFPSSPNTRIAKIAFPTSPLSTRSPNKDLYETGPTSTPPKSKRNLFGSFSALEELRVPLPSFPDSSSSIEVQTTKTQAPPPAPTKKSRTGAPVSVFKKQHEALINGTFKYDVTYLAKGSY